MHRAVIAERRFASQRCTHLAEEAVDYVVERRDLRQKPAGPDDAEKRELGGHRSRMLVLLSIWASYALGAMVGGFAELGWEIYAFIPPAGVLAVIVGVDLRWPWHAPTEDPLHAERQAVGRAA